MSSTADLVTQSVPDLAHDDHHRNNKEPTSFKSMKCKDQLAYIKQVVTVEPIIVAFMFSYTITDGAFQDLVYEKACRSNLNYNITVCQDTLARNHTYPNVLTESSVLISNANSWAGLIGAIVPLILILFMGSYSDRHHIRKPFFIVPLVGDLLANLACILSIVFMSEISLEMMYVLSFIVTSVMGGQVMLTMALFSYIADVSTVEMRTLRIGILQIAIQITSILALALNGIVFVTLGYVGTFAIAVAFDAFAVLYAYFIVKEPSTKEDRVVLDGDGNVETRKGLIADIFNTKHVMETLNVLLKKSKGNDRLFMVLIIVILVVYNVALIGEISLFNIYVFNAFNWDALDKSYFSTITAIVYLIGTSIAMSVFSVMWKFNDFVLLAIGFSTEILGRLVIGFTHTPTMYYIGSICTVFNGAIAVALRSLSSKVVSEADIGKAQSLISIFESIGSGIASPIYDAGIYNHTLKFMPSAFYLFSAILDGSCLLITAWMFFYQKRRDDRKAMIAADEAAAENQNNKVFVVSDSSRTVEMSRL